MEIIKQSLESGDDVMISGFGKFQVKTKKRMRNMKYWLVTILFSVLSWQTTVNQPTISDPIDTKFWVDFQKEWTGLDAENYRVYVIHNIHEFEAAPEDIKRQGIDKWQAFYPQDPWPPDNPPRKHRAGPYISGKRITKEAMEIIPAIIGGFVTNALY